MIRFAIAVVMILAVGVGVLGSAAPASAQATRTWVSGVGDDANPCSRTAPCKTFAGAISKTAAGGEISVLDPGGFGAVTITKSITINGDGTLAGILAAGANGIIVNAGVNDVVYLRNLTINGANTGLNGIRFLAGAALHLENVDIYGFRSASGKAIDAPIGTPNAELHVRNSALLNNTNGVQLNPTVAGSLRASFAGVAFVNNGSFGLRVDDRAAVSVQESQAVGNGTNGFLVASAGAASSLFVSDSLASGNGFAAGGGSGVRSSGAQATARISNNVITGNSEGITKLSSGVIESFENNYVTGNNTNVVGGAPAPVAQT